MHSICFAVGVCDAHCNACNRLNVLGYRIGTRVLELMSWRAEAGTKAPKREIRFRAALMSVHSQVWRAVFAKPADAIEKSVDSDDECESSQSTNVNLR